MLLRCVCCGIALDIEPLGLVFDGGDGVGVPPVEIGFDDWDPLPVERFAAGLRPACVGKAPVPTPPVVDGATAGAVSAARSASLVMLYGFEALASLDESHRVLPGFASAEALRFARTAFHSESGMIRGGSTASIWDAGLALGVTPVGGEGFSSTSSSSSSASSPKLASPGEKL